MKTRAILVIGLMALPSAAQIPPLPDGQITTTVSPATGITIGQTVTVTCRMSVYHGSAEIDSVNFTVRYDPSRFAFVNGSFSTGTASGLDQQWLSKAPQESAAEGYSLTNRSHGTVPGYVCIMMGDLGLTGVERGTKATNGFLISFQLQAVVHGPAMLTMEPGSDGSVVLDTSFRPVGTINLSSPLSVVIANPVSISVEAADPTGSEPGIDTPAFLLRRAGPTNAPVTVRFTMGGTARPGWDYQYIESSLAIPAGVSEALLVVSVYDDIEIEGDETVTLTLQSSTDYDASGTGTATVVIHDDENQAPIVSLTSPANGTLYAQPTNIVLSATASDPNGSVTNVEFYREGTVKIGEDSSAPYSFTWTNAPPGAYVLTAKAKDNLGATADSVPVSITVRGAPGVTLTCPTNFAASATATVSATATDPDGIIAFIEVYRDGAVWFATNGPGIARVWTSAAPGTYTLSARASDDRGLLTTSAPVVVTVTASGMTDMFDARGFLSGFTNYATANNSGFTKEAGEPSHGAFSGTNSAWVAWTAPAAGSVTIDTFGSSFDTVLAVYTNSPPSANAVSNLALVASNDEYGGPQSRVDFSTVAGQTYSIAVAAYIAPLAGTIHVHISQSNAAPSITSAPQSQVATVGDNVNFTVSASGGTLTYQWRWKGTNLSGATASSVTLTNVALTNAGLYDVLVSNSGGSVASAPAVLVVRAPADFVALPTNQVVNPGGTATFNVTASGSDPLNYQWSFKGVPMPGEVTNSYIRYNAQYADAGTYQVTVANAAGSATAGAELIVRPTFTSLTPSNGVLHLNWFGTTGKVYIVEGTTNLNPPSTTWTTLGTVTNTALQAQFQVSLTNPPARVIRLRVGP